MPDKQIDEALETQHRHGLAAALRRLRLEFPDGMVMAEALDAGIAALERQRDRPLKTTDTRVQAMFECPYCEKRFLLDTTIRWEGDDSSAPDPDN